MTTPRDDCTNGTGAPGGSPRRYASGLHQLPHPVSRQCIRVSFLKITGYPAAEPGFEASGPGFPRGPSEPGRFPVTDLWLRSFTDLFLGYSSVRRTRVPTGNGIPIGDERFFHGHRKKGDGNYLIVRFRSAHKKRADHGDTDICLRLQASKKHLLIPVPFPARSS
jgi:hypothetical protein